MSHGTIRKLFNKALLEYTDTTGMPVFLDNVRSFDQNGSPIEPPSKGEYLKVHLIPADTYDDSLSGDHKVYTGMYQVTIVTKYGVGSLRSESIADAIQNVFKLNRRFVDIADTNPIEENRFTVQVTSPVTVPEGRQLGVQWILPIHFEYRADTN